MTQVTLRMRQFYHEKADKKNDLHDIEDSTSVQIPRGDCSTVTLHC